MMQLIVKVFIVLLFTQLTIVGGFGAQNRDVNGPTSSSVDRDYFRFQGKMESEIGQIRKDIAGFDQKAEEAKTKARYLDFILIVLTCFGVAGFAYVRKTLNDRIRKIANEIGTDAIAKLKTDFENQFAEFTIALENEANSAIRTAEEKHFKYTHITALRYAHHYDEALEFVEWAGDYRPFWEEPSSIQRSLIMCLSNSWTARKSGSHLVAWKWAKALVEKEPIAANAITMLRTGNTLKHWADAVEFYDLISPKLKADDQEKCEPLLFVALRRARCRDNEKDINPRLKKLAAKHMDTLDTSFVVNIAAFYRDDGKFEEAERMMKARVNKLTGYSAIKHEEGWDRLFNTYIANCIDQGKAAMAIQQTKTLIANSKTTDHVFTCARLAWNLDKTDPEREYLFKIIRSRYESGMLAEKDDGAIKTIAIFMEATNQPLPAEKILNDAVEECINKSDKWSLYHAYYYNCMLAEIYLSRENVSGAGKAIELLSQYVNDDIGEAQFLIAKAYALLNSPEVMSKHLQMASSAKRKWIVRASYDKAFQGLKEVDELLSKPFSE